MYDASCYSSLFLDSEGFFREFLKNKCVLIDSNSLKIKGLKGIKYLNFIDNNRLLCTDKRNNSTIVNIKSDDVISIYINDKIKIKDGLIFIGSSYSFKGFINRKNKKIGISFDNFEIIGEDRILIKKDGKCALIDTKGNFLIPARYENIEYDKKMMFIS